MVSVSVRSLLIPGVALATAGAVALGPALVAPPALTVAAPTAQVPSVHIEDIQLAGIGLDIYNAIQPWVAYGVEWAMFATAWLPAVSDQIGILYYDGLNPTVDATVNYLSDVVSNPLNFFPITGGYINTLVLTGYRFINAELAWLGLPFIPPLPPFPTLPGASVATSPAPRAAARAVAAAAVAELPASTADLPTPTEVATDVTAEVPVPARASRGELRRAPRSAAVSAVQNARAAASGASQRIGAEVSAAAQTATGEVQSIARASRGSVAKAAGQARAAVQAAADAAS